MEKLGKRPGLLGLIFRKAQNKIQDPAKLRRLIVDLIDKEQWSSLSADVKGDAYEGLLQKNAEDVKGGAGQYFTPRSLIAAMVEVMSPQPGMTICDARVRDRWFPARRARLHRQDARAGQGREEASPLRHAPRRRVGGQRRPPLRDESIVARHRRAG